MSSIGATAMTDELAIVEKLMRFGPAYTTGHPDAPGGMTTFLPRINPDGPEAAAIIEGLVGLVHESLFHLRTDARAEAYHHRAQAALAKVRTPHHPDEGGRS